VSARLGSNQVPGVGGEGEREGVIAVDDIIATNDNSEANIGVLE